MRSADIYFSFDFFGQRSFPVDGPGAAHHVCATTSAWAPTCSTYAGEGPASAPQLDEEFLWQGGGVEAVGEAKVRPCGGRVDFVSDDFPQPLAAAASAELRGGTFEAPSHPRRVATTMEGDLDPMADGFLDEPDVADGAFDAVSTSGIGHLVQAPDLSGYRPDCAPGVDLADIVAANSEAVHVVVAWLNDFAQQLELEAMQARRKSFAD